MISEQNSARRLVEDEVRSTAEDCARDGVGNTVVQPANTCAQRTHARSGVTRVGVIGAVPLVTPLHARHQRHATR